MLSRSAPERPVDRTLVEGSRWLLDAEKSAGVSHHVCVSIVGCDRLPAGYFRVKADQEAVVEKGPVPWTVVRATQFHDLITAGFEAGARWRLLPVPRARLQTVAVADAARAVADVAEGGPRHRHVEVVGPEAVDARTLARQWSSLTGKRPLLLPLPLSGKLGRALRSGVATSQNPDVRGVVTFAARLRESGAVRQKAGR